MAAPLGTGRSRERMSLPIGKRGKVCFTDCPNLLAEQIPPNEKIPPTILYRGVTLNKNLKKKKRNDRGFFELSRLSLPNE